MYTPFYFTVIQNPTPTVDPCTPSPCGPFTTCVVSVNRPVCACMSGYLGSPEAGCEPGCTTNSDCPLSEACINRLCVEPCAGTCAPTAECKVVRHHPLCSCPDGYTGDPFINCRPKPSKEMFIYF